MRRKVLPNFISDKRGPMRYEDLSVPNDDMRKMRGWTIGICLGGRGDGRVGCAEENGHIRQLYFFRGHLVKKSDFVGFCTYAVCTKDRLSGFLAILADFILGFWPRVQTVAVRTKKCVFVPTYA